MSKRPMSKRRRQGPQGQQQGSAFYSLASKPDNNATDPPPAAIMHKRRLCFQWLGGGIVNAPDGANKAGARPNPALAQPFGSGRVDRAGAVTSAAVGWAKARLRAVPTIFAPGA